jgi:hypothetical protein
MSLGHRLAAAATLVTLQALASTGASADPLYLKPGQCIHLGNQEICAMMTDVPGGPVKLNIVHQCQYDFHPGRELPDLKNWALVQVVIKADGKKVQMLIKQFGTGDKDKAACDQEATSLNKP